MTFIEELKKAAKRLVWLLEIEVAIRIDSGSGGGGEGGMSLTWIPIGGNGYVTDSENDRIKNIRISDLGYVQQFGSSGAGNNQFSYPWGICTDETHLYITDRDNDRIKKHLCSDLSYVAKLGSTGAGDDEFNNPTSICTDGTHIYITDQNNSRIKKHLCSDLSYVGEYTGIANGDNHDLNLPTGVCIEGDHLWIIETGGGGVNRFIKVNKNTLAHIEHYHYSIGAGDDEFNNPLEMTSDGTYIYIFDQNNSRLKKHLATDFSFVSKYGVEPLWDCEREDGIGSGTGIFYSDGYLYIVDWGANCKRLKKHAAATWDYICKNGHAGGPLDGNDYSSPRTITAYGEVTYYASFPFPPGKIRVVDKTTGEVTEYSEAASIVDCEATEGTWYYDSTTSILYLHMIGDLSPSSGDFFISAYLWKRFCDGQYPAPEEIVFDGEWIRPRLKKDSIPDLTQEISGFDEGGVRQTWGSIILENADGELDEEIVDYIWENKVYIIKVGSPGDAYADYTVISRGRTGSIIWNEKEIMVGVGDPMKGED